jgi:hypothetical protein
METDYLFISVKGFLETEMTAMNLNVSKLSSGGIILSYQCSNQCRHCLYACGPGFREWMDRKDLDTVLGTISKHREFLTGLHFAGGEPFLNPDLLEYALKRASDLQLPIDYVETNAFWCRNKDKARTIMQRMRNAGLNAILISCSPFHQEFIPFLSVRNGAELAGEIFGESNVLIYTSYFFRQLSGIDPERPLPLDLYIEAAGVENASLAFASEYGLVPNGRVPVQLAHLYERKPAAAFYGETCRRELSSPHHIHVDLYGNYIAGLCAGISLGDGRDLDTIYAGLDISGRPVLSCLADGGVEALFRKAVAEWDYVEDVMGYIAKCHLCLDIRRHLVRTGRQFDELAPAQFYASLESEA